MAFGYCGFERFAQDRPKLTMVIPGPRAMFCIKRLRSGLDHGQNMMLSWASQELLLPFGLYFLVSAPSAYSYRLCLVLLHKCLFFDLLTNNEDIV